MMAKITPAGQQQEDPALAMQRALAAQKSYVGSAVVVFVLYWVCYLPGLIFNIMWLQEAAKTRRITGTAPGGMGCLQVMLLVGLLPFLVFGGMCGGLGSIDSPPPRRSSDPPQTSGAPATSPAEQQPAVSTVTEEPAPRPAPVYLMREEITVWDSPTTPKRSVSIPPPSVVRVIDQQTIEGYLWLKIELARSSNEAAQCWILTSSFSMHQKQQAASWESALATLGQ